MKLAKRWTNGEPVDVKHYVGRITSIGRGGYLALSLWDGSKDLEEGAEPDLFSVIHLRGSQASHTGRVHAGDAVDVWTWKDRRGERVHVRGERTPGVRWVERSRRAPR